MLASSGGWKHAAATPQLKDRFFAPTGAAAIIILRHPADWARSMHRNPFHTLCQVPRAFSDFLRQPWLTTARDALPERLVPDLVSLLAGKVDSYLWLLDTWPNSTVIRYEDLAKAPEEVLDHIGLPLPAAFKIPHADPRRFARKKRSNESYGERAAKASYDVLRQTDQQFLRTGLAGGICDRLYPE
ncbi:MAG: hypothetical protein OQK00_09965 [Rhodobacteraceae bacterium]|nr:hypothetical protein [Paracoccaceae bacterium]